MPWTCFSCWLQLYEEGFVSIKKKIVVGWGKVKALISGIHFICFYGLKYVDLCLKLHIRLTLSVNKHQTQELYC